MHYDTIFHFVWQYEKRGETVKIKYSIIIIGFGVIILLFCLIIIFGKQNDENIIFNKIAANNMLLDTQNYKITESMLNTTNEQRIILNDLHIPKDFNKKKTSVYDDGNITESVYINSENNRSVCLQSTNNEDDIKSQKQLCSSMKKSKIEDIDLYLFQYHDSTRKGDIYVSYFESNNVYYVLETKNCTEKEYVNILKKLLL